MGRKPPADRTYDDSWGAARTQLPAGRVRLALDGVTVEAETEKRARVELAGRLWVHVDGPADRDGLRQYHLAYAESKIERYTALRGDYAAMKPTAVVCAGCNADGSDQTAGQAITIIDEKLARFAAMAAEKRKGDRVQSGRVR